MTMGIFANCTFCLKVKYLPRQQKKKLQSDIKENGGKFSLWLNPQCTHLILDNADLLSQYQLDSIRKKHIHIASPDFVWESIKERKLLDIESYGPTQALDITLPPDQKTGSSDVKADDLPLDDVTEKESIVEPTKFHAENVDFPQDFEVAKYNTLEKVGTNDGPEVVVVELCCSRDSGDCPFLISAHFLLADGVQTRRQATVKKTSAEASEYYENYIEELKKQGFLLRDHFTPKATQLASGKLQALLLEEVLGASTLSTEVSDLVELLWAEALGHLEHTLLKPVNKISLNDVSKAEGILLLAKSALKNGETAEQLQKLMAEFYRLIPHKGPATEEVNLKLLAKEEDLCQLIRDMVNVCETNLSKPNPPSLAKYRALRCKIEYVEQNTEEFFKIKKEILQSSRRKSPVNILQIFRVGKVNETTEFQSTLGNVRLLLHGSPVRNLVGILSRGLLLPKVVEGRGVHRTDAGNLGSGIYFSDSLSASIKYSHPGETEGTRVLVVCDVALGECIEFHKKDLSLTEAPHGYHSVHGVSRTASLNTDFEDDEFVVYKTNQIKMKYIIKFCLPGDQVKKFHPPENTELEEYRPMFSSISKAEDYQLPDTQASSNTQAGLQDTSGNLIPLENVHIKGRIIDFVAQVVVFQTYTNQSHVPIEAKYIFPLDDKAAVCGFEAFINGKHIVGEIKEKEEAQREYREAISEGHGAYLMDQDAPDIFTVSVGNLPPKAKVLIKITYITELSLQGPVAVFFMPATVAPWQQDKALNENLQDTVTKVCVKEIGKQQSFSLTMSIEMPYVIKSISSDTHKLKQKSTDCKAVISTVEGSSLDSNGFSLHVSLSDAYLPRMWVEKHPEKESEACMLVFQPHLAATLPELAVKSEVIICLDCSNSMEGVTFRQAKQIALHALSLVGEKQKVNVVQFGTGYKELFSYPKHIASNNAPTEFILSATPTLGNTDFWKTLRYLSLLYPAQGLRNILLISDGHLQSESLTLQLVKRNVHHTRLFTCGVGSTANRHILRTLSQYGAGVFEYFNSNSKQSWKKQIEEQMTRLRSPSCHSVSVKWQQLNLDAPEPLQAPAQVPSLFHNDRLLVYGFIPHCTQATLCALIDEKEFQAMVSTTELQKTTGTMIHKLTARALIRDYEDGILHENETSHEMKKQSLKSLIVKLSKENSLITQFTSFVAVEKRDGNESPFPNTPNISKLIAEEDVDFLPYMNWQEKQPGASTAQRLPSVSACDEEVQPKYLVKKKLKRRMLQVLETMEEADSDSQLLAEPLTPYLGCGDPEMFLDLRVMDSQQQPEITVQLDRGVPENAVASSFPVGAAAYGCSAMPPPPPLPGASFASNKGRQVFASRFLSLAAASDSSAMALTLPVYGAPSPSYMGPQVLASKRIASSFPLAAAAGGSSSSPPPPPLPDASSSSRTCLQGPLFGSSFSFDSLSPFKHSDPPNDGQRPETSSLLQLESSPSPLRRIPKGRLSSLSFRRSKLSELPEPLRAQSSRLNVKNASPGPHSLFARQGPSVGPTGPRSPSYSPLSPSVYCAQSVSSPVLSVHQRPLLSSLPARAAPSGSPTGGLCADDRSVSDACSNVESYEVEGVGAADPDKDGVAKGAEAIGDSEEDGEDVFEVEKILDMKTEGGKILYKVRWKGYTSDDDTWEPEIHLEDCKEVLLEFRKKVAENKARTVKKDIQRLSLNNDIFEANSDSDQQSETKEDTSPRKKKKKLRQREEKSPEDLKKKKAKTGKLKDKSKPDLESSSESLVFDLRTKKRILEAKEELKEPKKAKKDEIKETKELKKVKKGEMRDLKTKIREDPKENRKTKKEKSVESLSESESIVINDSPLQEDNNEELVSDNRDEEQNNKNAKDAGGQDGVQEIVFEKQVDGTLSAEEDTDNRSRRKKKKPRKTEDPKESKKLENKSVFSEKKTLPKKPKNQDKGRSTTELDRLTPVSAQTHKTSRLAEEERGLRSSDSAEEEKETQKNEPKEKYQKRHDSDKEEKSRKEPKGLKTFKEIKTAFDLFKKTPEEKNDVPENSRKKEELPLDCKTTEDQKTKENKQSMKERRNTREETDTWAHIAAEGDPEVLDSVCHSDENLDGRQQILSLGMDLQLEWMKLEDFQKHLDGEDENFTIADAIPSNLLRDAVKNGDYITVKVALNSNEEYNLDQEDSSGMTLVMLAAAGGQDDLLRLLITKGAKVNGRQKNGTTALIHAAEKNFLTTVAILLEAGAFVNVQQSSGETALMKACKRGNSDIVRLVIECGADCNILSKHQNSALHFAKQSNNVLVYDLLKNHLETLSRVAEETIRDYFEARLALLEPVFPIACHRLCEGPDFSTDFHYKPPQNIPEGSGILLFIFHANFLGKEVIARLCGPCSVQAVVLNDKFQLPIFLDSHFVYSFSPVAGPNKLFIRLTEAPSAKVKLLIGAYRVQLQ